jgi:hypothetical protein
VIAAAGPDKPAADHGPRITMKSRACRRGSSRSGPLWCPPPWRRSGRRPRRRCRRRTPSFRGWSAARSASRPVWRRNPAGRAGCPSRASWSPLAVRHRPRLTTALPDTRKSVLAGVDIGRCRGYGFSRSRDPRGLAETNCRPVVQEVAVRRMVRWRSFEARVVAGRRRDWRPDRVARSDQGLPSAGPRLTRWQYQ